MIQLPRPPTRTDNEGMFAYFGAFGPISQRLREITDFVNASLEEILLTLEQMREADIESERAHVQVYDERIRVATMLDSVKGVRFAYGLGPYPETGHKTLVATQDSAHWRGSNELAEFEVTFPDERVNRSTITVEGEFVSQLDNVGTDYVRIVWWDGSTEVVNGVSTFSFEKLVVGFRENEELLFRLYGQDVLGNQVRSPAYSFLVVGHYLLEGTLDVDVLTVERPSRNNSLSLSGVTSPYDESGVFYDIVDSGDFTFTKTERIATGEVVHFSVPNFVTSGKNGIRVRAYDSLGGELTGLNKIIPVEIMSAVGVLTIKYGEFGGGAELNQPVLKHIDRDGNIIEGLTKEWFDGHPVFQFQDTTYDSQLMVNIPKMYTKMDTVPSGEFEGKERVWVSSKAESGFTIHPAFMHQGNEVPSFELSKYYSTTVGGKMTSQANNRVVGPTSYKLHTELQNLANARNVGAVTGFTLMSIYHINAVIVRVMVEFKDSNPWARAWGTYHTNYRGVYDLWNPRISDAGLTPGYNLNGLKVQNYEIHIWDNQGRQTYVNTKARVKLVYSGIAYNYFTESGSNFNLNGLYLMKSRDFGDEHPVIRLFAAQDWKRGDKPNSHVVWGSAASAQMFSFTNEESNSEARNSIGRLARIG